MITHTNKENFRIYRNNKLEIWRTYSPQILPAIVKTIEYSLQFIEELITASESLIEASQRQMQRIVNGETIG